MIVKSKINCGQPPITKLIYNNRSYTEKASIAHQINTHFIKVGRELPNRLPKTIENVNQYQEKRRGQTGTLKELAEICRFH